MIKGLCTVSTGSVVNLLVGGELPEVGHYYYLESATEGTGAQNRAFHSLLSEYFTSGEHSYNADSLKIFKEKVKISLGEGFEKIYYSDVFYSEEEDKWKAIRFEVKHKSDIPEHILKDPDLKETIIGKVKSWSDYTKKQRTSTIDNLISEMLQAGINSKKFEEILKGMEPNG